MLCKTGICLSKSKYCNGHNDCGDGSDEPEDCSNCADSLAVLHPDRVCDGVLDCVGKDDIGTDESADECCDHIDHHFNETYPYRCVLGKLTSSKKYLPTTIVTDQCISSKGVCDWDAYPEEKSCSNGADELDCVVIWQSPFIEANEPEARDPFGRFLSGSRGYLYFVSFGRKYLYCAGQRTWTSENLNVFGAVICKKQGFPGLAAIRLHEPRSRTRVGKHDIALAPSEEDNYKACKLVFIACRDTSFAKY